MMKIDCFRQVWTEQTHKRRLAFLELLSEPKTLSDVNQMSFWLLQEPKVLRCRPCMRASVPDIPQMSTRELKRELKRE